MSAAERALDRMFSAQLAELQRQCPPEKPRNPWLCSDEEYDATAPALPVSDTEE